MTKHILDIGESKTVENNKGYYSKKMVKYDSSLLEYHPLSPIILFFVSVENGNLVSQF